MTVFTDPGFLVARWKFTADGYDAANARLTDLSGNGFHLPLLHGAPSYSARGGFTGIDLHGGTWFGMRPDWLLAAHTVVATFAPNLANFEELAPFWSTKRTYPDSGDPAYDAPSDAFEGNSGSALRLYVNNGVVFYGDGGGDLGLAQTAISAGAWHAVAGICNPAVPRMGVAVDGGAPVPATGTATLEIPAVLDDFRVGYRDSSNTPITTGGGQYFTMGQICVYAGGIFVDAPAAAAALMAALQANPVL